MVTRSLNKAWQRICLVGYYMFLILFVVPSILIVTVIFIVIENLKSKGREIY